MDPMLRVGRRVPDDPVVSIVVLVVDDVDMVHACLDSLRRTIDSAWRAEFVVVANGTPLSRLQSLQRHDDIVLVRSETNLGFAGGNNLGARAARADWLVFLNDDALVDPDWLDQLVRTASLDPSIGIVGSRILFEDGSLQEAGSVIWGDGPTTGVGRGLPPGTRQYLYVRDVDFISANGMLVRRSAWDAVGGFSEEYYPAYYEDVDLCMAVRQRGLRIVYEPRAVITHLEGGSSSYRYRMFLMSRQRRLFRTKWAREIAGFEPYRTADRPAAIDRAVHRGRGSPRQVLVLDDALPDAGLGSGFSRAALVIEELVASGCAVTMRPLDSRLGDRRCSPDRTSIADRLTDLGVDVRYEPMGVLLKRFGHQFDVVLCSRPRSFGELRPQLGHLRSEVPVVYDSEAIWFRGLEREAKLAEDPDRARRLSREAAAIRSTELAAMTSADHVVAVSADEAGVINAIRSRVGRPDGAVTVIGGEAEHSRPDPAGWSARRGILFPAGWLAGADSPNLTSLRYFVSEILPLVVEEVPWIRVLVTGGDPPAEALELAGPNVTFLGYVPEMQALLRTVRVVAVPMRTGAGRKFKTLEALLAGVPTVATTVGAEGYDTSATGGLVVTDDPEHFARALVELHEDPDRWAEERRRVDAFCDDYDSRPQLGWAKLVDRVVDEGRLRAEPEPYHQWLLAGQPRSRDLDGLRRESEGWKYRPTVSVCVPVYNPRPGWLEEAVASVRRQTYDRLELCLVDDGSSQPMVGSLLDRLEREDPRVRTVRRATNGGISVATNEAIRIATGEFVAFLDQDDLLAPQALHRVVARLQEEPQTDLFYCDEDKLALDRRRCQPFFKPGWSPETLLSFNYVTHFVVARRALVERIGRLRPHLDGSQDHDLLLRATEVTDSVCHLDDVLYTWRQSATSTASSSRAKPEAAEATVRVVQDALDRRKIAGRVVQGRFGGQVVIRHARPTVPAALIVTALHDSSRRLASTVPALRAALGDASDVIVSVPESLVPPPELRQLEATGCRVLETAGSPSRLALLGAAISSSSGELFVAVDASVTVISPDWATTILGWSDMPGVGAVGVRVVDSGGRPLNEGIAVGSFGAARIVSGRDEDLGARTAELLASTRNVSAVSDLCLALPRSAWERSGGGSTLAGGAGDSIDLFLRLAKAGYRVVYTPEVSVRLDDAAVSDADDGESRYPDPYWSVHLPPAREREERAGDATPIASGSDDAALR